MELLVLLSVLVLVGSDLNTGTVLFIESDVARSCWSPSSARLLVTRMLVEDLLPCPSILGIMDDEVVGNLLDYFKLVDGTITSKSRGNRRNSMMLAFNDALGGYLRHVVLPNVKYSFYAGALSYRSVERISKLYKDTKYFLRTNGKGWADPVCEQSCHYEPRTFPLDVPKDPKACDQLTLYFAPRNAALRRPPCYPEAIAPLPYFDRPFKPTVLAVPLKSYPLRGMQAPWGLNLVVKYYLTGYRCLSTKTGAPLRYFNDGVFSWLLDEVVPLVEDEEIYTTLGSVLRVVATLRRIGARRTSVAALRAKYARMMDGFVTISRPTYAAWSHGTLLGAILLFIFLWLVVSLCFYLRPIYRSNVGCDRRSRSRERRLQSPGKKLSWHPRLPKRTTMCANVEQDEKNATFAVNDAVYTTFESEEEETEEDGPIESIDEFKTTTEESETTSRRIPPYTFGYDFQTSTSESASDSDSELDLHVRRSR